MTKQIIGYYGSRKERLLNDLDITAVLLENWLNARYGEELAGTLRKEIREEYGKLIPEIPYIKGLRASMLNKFLVITAQELAVYKAMQRNGKSPEEAWEICHRALRLRTAKIPRWKRWLWKRLMFSNPVGKIMAGREKAGEKGVFGDFEIQYLGSKGNEFDLGVNYLKCGNLDFAKQHGGEEFAPYICLSDIALSDALGWGLNRTQTLADGCKYCDFRFKKGAPTKITSKTPEVQKFIERINKLGAEGKTQG